MYPKVPNLHFYTACDSPLAATFSTTQSYDVIRHHDNGVLRLV
jgi:hypothetical protein